MKHIAVAVDPLDRPEALLAHGLKLALLHRATLTVCLVDRAGSQASVWGQLPGVRALLTRWGVLPEGADTAAFEALGIHIRPLEAPDADVAHALLAMVAARAPDLLILGTHGRVGLERLLRGSVAERVSRGWHGPTLVLPPEAGLVDVATGALSLDRVLLPVSGDAGTGTVIDTLVALLDGSGVERADVTVLHVGDGDPPLLTFPDAERWGWHGRTLADGPVVDGILTLVDHLGADLVAMGTHGHDHWVDAVLGSHTERVLRRASCAVLTVPLG